MVNVLHMFWKHLEQMTNLPYTYSSSDRILIQSHYQDLQEILEVQCVQMASAVCDSKFTTDDNGG